MRRISNPLLSYRRVNNLLTGDNQAPLPLSPQEYLRRVGLVTHTLHEPYPTPFATDPLPRLSAEYIIPPDPSIPEPITETTRTAVTTEQKMSVPMITFNSTFSGLPGESPEEYLEEVEIYGLQVAPDNESLRAKQMNVAFRSGLRGTARLNWYLKLPADKRKWETVTELFKKRFQLRDDDMDQNVGTQVYTFTRQNDETVPAFVRRATELSYQCNEEQTRELTRRLFATLPGPPGALYEQGRHLQETVAGRLYSEKKLGRGNVLSNDCTFEDVRGCIIDCFLPPGAVENPFLENKGTDHYKTEDNVVLQMGGLMKELFEQVREIKSAPRTPVSMTPTVQAGQVGPSGDRGREPYQNGLQRRNSYGQQSTYQPPAARGGFGGGFRGGARGGGYAANTQPRSYSHPFTCYNCGEQGHGITRCEQTPQSSSRRDEIRQLVEQGKPIPEHLRPVGFFNNQAGPVQSMPAKLLTLTEGPLTGHGDASGARDAWEEWVDGHETLPAMVSERSRKRTRTTAGNPDDDEAMFEARRPSPLRVPSPHPRQNEPAEVRKRKDAINRMKEKLDEVVQSRTRSVKKDTIPIRAMEGIEDQRFGIRELLKNMEVRLTLGQLLDRSPQLRSQMMFQLGLQNSARGRKQFRKTSGKRAKSLVGSKILQSRVGRITFADHALPESETTCLGYVEGLMNGVASKRLLIDDGSLAELISPKLAHKLNLQVRKCEKEMCLKLADDSTSPIRHYALLPVVVGEILTVVRAYITGESHTYDVVLGRSWLKRVRAKIDYDSEQLTVKGRSGFTKVIPIIPVREEDDRVLDRPFAQPVAAPSGEMGDEEQDTESSGADDTDDESSSSSSETDGEWQRVHTPSRLSSVVSDVEFLDLVEYAEEILAEREPENRSGISKNE